MGVWVKSPKGSNFSPPSTIRSFNKMVGLAPTRVMVPPMMAQKPMGIKMRDIGTPILLAIRWAAGRNSAAAPMFCIILEMMPTVPDISVMTFFSLLPASLIMGPATLFITPVLSKPAPMIITAIMEHTALLLKPTKASVGDTRPISGSITIMIMPTTSTLTHSKINRIITKTKTIIVKIISGVIRNHSFLHRHRSIWFLKGFYSYFL